MKDPRLAPTIASALSHALEHRGPDGTGHWIGPQYGLVQTRLAVIDLSSRVHYPMTNEDGRLHLVFNGEIYNHLELRRQLIAAGHTFKSSCDAEVVLHGYEEWGADVLVRLDGMFALAIADSGSDELLLARDRFGVKPLVHTTGNRSFGFASTALALVAAGLASSEVDELAIGAYLRWQYMPGASTGLTEVKELPPGTLLRRLPSGHETLIRWAAEPFSASGPKDGEVALDELDQALSLSVRRQLAADVPVGVLLSSGVDSSLLLSYAAEYAAGIEAFTISFESDGDYNEGRAAREFAGRLGVPHTQLDFSVTFGDALKTLGGFDQPFADSSALAAGLLARLVRGRVKVVLSGTGGDDLFAGYYRHRAYKLLPLVSRLPTPKPALLKVLQPAGGTERKSVASLGTSYLARALKARAQTPWGQYVALVTSRSDALAGLVEGSEYGSASVAKAIRWLDHHGDDREPMRGIQRFELAQYLPNDLLVKEDRAFMAEGLEARVPLLDEAILDIAERMPSDQKSTVATGKRPLRQILEKRCPGRSVGRVKRGFAVPIDDLLRNSWNSDMREWLDGITGDRVDGPGLWQSFNDGEINAGEAWSIIALADWESRVTQAGRAAVAE